MPAIAHNNKILGNTNSLDDMSDVTISTPSAGQVLGYDGNGWKNTAAPGGGGSIINVTTSESSLYGKTVTLTDGTTTLSASFDNSGKSQFTGVTLTGTLTISSSNGTSTATGTLTVNYFGVYTKTLSFFTAYLTVTFPASVGATCTVNGVTATTSPHTFTVNSSSATYVVTLDGQTQAGGVTLSDGQTKSVTVEYGTINVTYSNEFRGTSITCTKDSVTITKTAPSAGNSLAFYPPTTGSWTISGTYSGTTYSTSATVSSLSTAVSATLETIPNGSTVTPVNDVQKLLNCAGIFNKNYTTINQLLADSTSLLAVISDNNAVNYLVRSTGFASNMCANSTAMTDIGANNYCANTLLADSTWASAIANSTYFESVLNVKVPTMTSNTTPSGEAFSSVIWSSGYEAYKVFDGDGSTECQFSSSGSTLDSYVGYIFPNPTVVKKVKIVSNTWQQLMGQFDIEASNDGVTYTTLGSGNITASGTIEISLNNDTAYTHYRLNKTSGGAGSWISINEVQFYGRASS